MTHSFTHCIAPYVDAELARARQARRQGDPAREFHHLENAHVLGQQSTRWHVQVHGLMLLWALRQGDSRELAGQLLRLVGAATKTALGWVPAGNTGGARVSPFKPMPISPRLARCIARADKKSCSG